MRSGSKTSWSRRVWYSIGADVGRCGDREASCKGWGLNARTSSFRLAIPRKCRARRLQDLSHGLARACDADREAASAYDLDRGPLSRRKSGILLAMRYRRHEEVAFRQLGEECLLVPIRTHPGQEMAVFRLNEVGAFVWQALAAPQSEEGLCRLLADAFDVDEKQARRDLGHFIELLEGKRLIARVEE